MALSPDVQKQLLTVFRSDLDDQLQVITDNLLKLEKGIKAKARQKALELLMRATHNIKGAARGVGVTAIGEITHHMETLFSALSKGSIPFSGELVDLCLGAVDHIRDAMTAHEKGEAPGFDLEALLADLDEGAAKGSMGSSEQPSPDEPRQTKLKASAEEEKAEPSGAKVTPESVEPRRGEPEQSQEEQAPAPPAATGSAAAEGKAESGFIRVTVEKLEEVSALFEELQVAKIEMDEHGLSMQQLCKDVEQLSAIWDLSPNKRSAGTRHTLPEEMTELYSSSAAAVTEFNKTIAHMHQDMRGKVNHLGIVLTSLQDEMRRIRLVAASTLLRPLARSARDIAREMNKQINFEVIGEETEVDRAILEKLRDPLTHLVRNAIDHGIEPLDQRKAAGKTEAGNVTLRVGAEGSQIVIEVKDDGAGVSIDRVVRTAVKKKLVTEEEAKNLERESILDLIFRPGFSTKEIITDVSGRGIGMDVVHFNLQSIKGSIRVDSAEGQGSTFTIHVPLTLATEHGLTVRAGNQIFAVPITAVDRILHLGREDIVDVESGQAMISDGAPIPLRHLSQCLGMKVAETIEKDGFTVIIVSAGRRRVAMVVEEVTGQQEMVIKPLQPPLVSVRNVSGGTLTGRRGVVIVLNPSELVDSALERGKTSRVLPRAEAEVTAVPQILVVDDSLTTRTLEKNILENYGYKVTVAVDGKEAWETLQGKHFDLVTTDVMMPVMDGFELTETIKNSEKFRDIPVIIVTSLANETDKQRGIEVGADAYIVKDQFETKALIDVVRQLV